MVTMPLRSVLLLPGSPVLVARTDGSDGSAAQVHGAGNAS